jgi:long-chain acyl-CoA synthetase
MFFDDLGEFSRDTALLSASSKSISYQALTDSADRIGDALTERCLVFLVCRNCVDCLAGYLGLLRARCVPVLINENIDPVFFIRLLDTYRPNFVYLPSDTTQLAFESTETVSVGAYVLAKTEYTADYALHDDLALLLATSGSTGSPKLVRQSYLNISSNAESIAHYLEISGADRPITTMPMSYSYGLSIINSHLLKGASIVVSDATLMERRFWDEIKLNRVTTLGGVPYLYEMLKRLQFSRMELPSLEYLTQAGGKLDIALFAAFVDMCEEKDLRFVVMYGQTEATARMSYLPWKHARSKLGSIGLAIPGGRFWLEDEKRNKIVAHDKIGELIYEGENVTMGYAESCYDLSLGDENRGILRTGDLAKRDTDGFYYITGRLNRFLKVYGNRVNLDEIEQLIRGEGHDCACVGTDDNVVIFLTEPERTGTVERIVAKRTGINRSAFSSVYIDEIPRTESGKIRYASLRDEGSSGRHG